MYDRFKERLYLLRWRGGLKVWDAFAAPKGSIFYLLGIVFELLSKIAN
jgi:hypothetical protein